MSLVYADRVKESTTTTGTGSISLGGAETGFQSFSVIGNGNTCYYTIAGQSTGEWEVGLGTYTLSSATLARTTVYASSNSNNLVPFSAGTKDVFITLPAVAISSYLNKLTVGSTSVVSGTGGYILYNAGGTLGNLATTGSGNVVLATSPTLTTPVIGAATGTSLAVTGALTTGTQGSVQGSLILTNTNSTYATTVQSSNSSTAAWTMTLPTSSGSAGQLLSTNGSGVTSWVTGGLIVNTSPTSGGAAGQIMFDTGSVLQESSNLVWDNTNKALTLGGGTVTTSNPVLNMTQTWNASGTTFTGVKLNVTNTASASGSLLLDLQAGGSSVFNVNPYGATLNLGAVSNGVLSYFKMAAATSTFYSYFGTTSPGNQYSWFTNLYYNGSSFLKNDSSKTSWRISQIVASTYNGSTVSFDYFNTSATGNGMLYINATSDTSSLVSVGSTSGFAFGNGVNPFGATFDTILTRRAAANLNLGAADAAAPVAQTLSVQSVAAGTSNTAGTNFTIAGSQGTGTGAGGSIIFQTAPAGSTGTSQNALSTLLTLSSAGTATISSGTQTTSVPALSITQTWNNASTTFDAPFLMNITNTASANNSKFVDLQISGTSYWTIGYYGGPPFFSIANNANAGTYYSCSGFAGTNIAMFVGTSIVNSTANTSVGFYTNSSTSPILFAATGTATLAADPANSRFSFGTAANSFDLFLTRRAAANIQHGAADAAAPVAQTLSVQSVVAGTSNTAGANFTIAGSQGTGTGAGGSIIFQTAPAGTTGTSQNALTTALTIAASGAATFSNTLSASYLSLPANNSVNWAGTPVLITGTSAYALSISANYIAHYGVGNLNFQTNTGTIQFQSGVTTDVTTTFKSIASQSTNLSVWVNSSSTVGVAITGSTSVPMLVTSALTYATLPSPSATGAGGRAFITDSNTQATSANFGATISSGGGSYKVPLWTDGTSWYIG